MYYRNAVRCFARTAYGSASTIGGIIGLYHGFDIAERNRCPHFEKLTTPAKIRENVCAFTIIGGSTIMGSMLGPPLLLASPFLYPIAPNYIKNLVNIPRDDSL